MGHQLGFVASHEKLHEDPRDRRQNREIAHALKARQVRLHENFEERAAGADAVENLAQELRRKGKRLISS